MQSTKRGTASVRRILQTRLDHGWQRIFEISLTAKSGCFSTSCETIFGVHFSDNGPGCIFRPVLFSPIKSIRPLTFAPLRGLARTGVYYLDECKVGNKKRVLDRS